MSLESLRERLSQSTHWLPKFIRRDIPSTPLTIVLAGIVGVITGYGSIFFTFLIEKVSDLTLEQVLIAAQDSMYWVLLLLVVPAVGLLVVSWMTRRFAPEAEGHGVPEVMTAMARNDGRIRPRVAIVKILASGLCIGTGGSMGREGPIVQIGAALGSVGGQWCRLPPRLIRVLVAAGGAAGISATFNAPIAGALFSSEIILGSFAVENLTPIVIASVLANVVQKQWGAEGANPAFQDLHYTFSAAWGQLPLYLVLGLFCGLAAVSFTKMVYATEDLANNWLPRWWNRALVCGLVVGLSGAIYCWTHSVDPPASITSQAEGSLNPLVADDATMSPETNSAELEAEEENYEEYSQSRWSPEMPIPPLMGSGYAVMDHSLRLENKAQSTSGGKLKSARAVQLDNEQMLAELLWLLPLFLLKPVITSITLAGGGSGGIFAPSLYIGATLGAVFGLACNLWLPDFSANPGVYAIVGMGAVVAGTTQGTLSAIIIVYEMTNDYRIILPIMATAGIASLVARLIDPESIYEKKLSRRGESIARGHDLHRVEHIMVRDVMVRKFPTVHNNDHVAEIVRVARANSNFESLPVMDPDEKLVGIIRPGDLRRVLDSDISAFLVNAEDIAFKSEVSVSPSDNLLEALREFGTLDVETLPVVQGRGESRRLVGLLLRSDVMRRYREEMLRR